MPESPSLCSDACVFGLGAALACPTLASKAAAANALVSVTFDLVKTCDGANKPWFVLNPVNSYLWKFPQRSRYTWTDCDLHACAHGGPRPCPQRMRS